MATAKLDRTMLKVVRLNDKSSDFAYWQSQPYSKRLETLESIRNEYNNWTDDTEQRLQRVYRVTKLK